MGTCGVVLCGFIRDNHSPIPRQLLEAIGAGPQTKILDVACGSACMTAMAAATGAQVEGVDFSPNMVDEAKRRYPALSFRQADAEALPFADDTFDAIAVGFGVHHFPFPVRSHGPTACLACFRADR